MNNSTIVIGSKMFFQPILLLMVFRGVCSYYLYNPQTNDILVLSSLANVPDGYKLMSPPYQRRSSKQDDHNHVGQCSDPGFFCIKPYDSLQTYQFHCSKDSQCPHFYKCCRHRCFIHKICVKATIHREDTNRKPPNSNHERQGTCEKWPYSCHTPYHHSLTSIFKCENDKQCPKAFKCCQQSCFEHKICSKAIAYKHEYVEELRWNEAKDIRKTTGSETDENDLINISSTEIIPTTETDESTTENEATELETSDYETTTDETNEVETPENETAETEITDVEKTENEITDYETTTDETNEVETPEEETAETEYVEELESTAASDEPGLESTETSIDNAQEITYGDSDVNSDFETTAEITASESNEITTEIEYVRFNSTEQEENTPREVPSFKNPTLDPNAIIPEYSGFYQYYDYPNETEYDTDSSYS